MNLNNFKELFPYFILGFFSLKIWDLINPTKIRSASEKLLEILCYGFIYNRIVTIFSENSFLVINHKEYSIKNIILFLIVILMPICLKKIMESSIIKTKIVNTTCPTSWDYFFSKREECILVIYLKDKEKPIVGEYSYNSFASSYPYIKDLYLEKMYTIKEDGELFEKNNTKGIYIPLDNIEYIEFVDK